MDSERTAEWNQHRQYQVRRSERECATETFDKLYWSQSVYVDNTEAHRLGITCMPLHLFGDGLCDPDQHYFRPQRAACLRMHTIDPEDKKTEQRVALIEKQWTDPKKHYCGDYASAEIISTTLAYAFHAYQRVSPENYSHDRQSTQKESYNFEENSTLEEISGWTHRQLTNETALEKYMQPSDQTAANDRITGFWKSRTGHSWLRDDSKPHISFIIENANPPNEQLLRAEVLTILGLIRSRLAAHTLREHRIIPVHVVSCMDGCAARIIQAHYSQGRLIVYKSRLYYFNDPHLRQSYVDLFLLYLASEPVGNTVG
ncbi:hypothetical protein BDW62DRAFT_219470 [Aspergillus aurantiobrunneus]